MRGRYRMIASVIFNAVFVVLVGLIVVVLIDAVRRTTPRKVGSWFRPVLDAVRRTNPRKVESPVWPVPGEGAVPTWKAAQEMLASFERRDDEDASPSQDDQHN